MIYVKGIVYNRYQIIFFQMDTLTLGGSYEVSGFGFQLLRSSLLTPLAQTYIWMNLEDKTLLVSPTVHSKNPSYRTRAG
jgi:hypothetical protein